MLNRFVARVALLGAMFAAGAGIAAAQGKVAIINLQKAVIDTAEIKKAQAELQARYKPKQDQIDKLNKELADIQAQISSGKLNPAGEQQAQANGQRKQRDLQRLTEDTQAEFDRDRAEILNRAGQRMGDVVKKMADEKGYDVVVDISNTVYFKPSLEITNEAVAAYDRTFPVK